MRDKLRRRETTAEAPGSTCPPLLPQGATPGIQDTCGGVCVYARVSPSGEPRRGPSRLGHIFREEICTGDSATGFIRSCGGGNYRKADRTASRELAEGRASTRTTACAREIGVGWRNLKEGPGGSARLATGHHRKTRPPLTTARLLPSTPRTRTVLTSPTTPNEPTTKMLPLQRNTPSPWVTPSRPPSSLAPQPLEGNLPQHHRCRTLANCN